MAEVGQGWLLRRLRDRAARHWDAMARHLDLKGGVPDPLTIDHARTTHAALTRFLQASDALSARNRQGLHFSDLPPGTDWRWRPMILRGRISPSAVVGPENGQQLSDEVTLWHDCPHSALILRQKRNLRSGDATRHALSLEVMGFSGSYLSLSLNLPDDVREGLASHHILRFAAVFVSEHPITIYARLNIVQGPNTETMLRQLGYPVEGENGVRKVEFDLAYTELAPQPAERVWLDLIFEAPRMNAVTLVDAILSRHPRAQA